MSHVRLTLTMFTYDSDDEAIDPMVEGYNEIIAIENRKRIRRNYERRLNAKRKRDFEESLQSPYTEKDVISSLHVPLPTKRQRSIYDNVQYHTNREKERVAKVTQQLQARSDALAAQQGIISKNREARMLRELEEYGVAMNKIYQLRADAKKARLLTAARKKNEYQLRQHFINVLNTK